MRKRLLERAWAGFLGALVALLLARHSSAQTDARPIVAVPPAAAAPADSWAGQLEALGKWVAQHGAAARCTERCYTLEKLRLTGKVGEAQLEFELRGGVLASGPVAVPLFGPPSKVRIDGAREGDKDASIGFEGDRYYVFTAARRFVLKGSVTLDGDLALSIPGPLNTLDADLEGGAVVEGSRLSGISSATIHFSKEGSAGPTGPTVFQLSRAIRVGKEIGFTYRLVMRSGADLGVVRVPLELGEKVLDVAGSSGWRVEEKDLVLPTSGRSAEITITGSLAKMASFAPDGRSGYEWWLFESDPEHRVTVKTDARQVDSAESPIPRTQATSRLYLVQKGQKLDVIVQPLAGAEVLAAVVRSHSRTIVLTHRGDLVSDDNLAYENNGIDYLLYSPASRPIYLASDGKPERIMHQGEVEKEILIPLLTGSHNARVQALGAAQLRSLGGKIELPMPSYPLTASRVTLNVGVPAGVIPIALLGGDRMSLRYGDDDIFAVILGFAVGFFAVRPEPSASPGRSRGLRILGGAVLAGLWLLSPVFFVLALITLGIVGFIWVMSRLVKGPVWSVLVIAAVGLLCLVGLISFAARPMGSRSPPMDPSDYQVQSPAPASSTGSLDREGKGRLGNVALQQLGEGGVLQGVTPVALTLPSYRHSMSAARELVTRERAFRPTLYYVTEWALLPFGVVWFLGALGVIFAHRTRIAGTYRRIRERLDRGPEASPEKPEPSGEKPAAPPPDKSAPEG